MEFQLSPEQEDQIKQAWSLFDDDDSGKIDKNELRQVMQKLGLNPTQDELTEIVNDIDKDGDGDIDFSEFLRLMSTKLKDAQTEEELLEAFKVFDTKNKQRFGETELTEICKRLKCEFSQEEIKEMISVADINGDGYIDFEEFVRIMLMHE